MKPVGPDQPLTWFWFSGCLQQRLPRICTKQLLKPNAGCSCISLHCVETDKSANFCTAEKLFSPTLPRLCILLSNTTYKTTDKVTPMSMNHTIKVYNRNTNAYVTAVFWVSTPCSKGPFQRFEEYSDSIFSVTICLRCDGVKWGTKWNQP